MNIKRSQKTNTGMEKSKFFHSNCSLIARSLLSLKQLSYTCKANKQISIAMDQCCFEWNEEIKTTIYSRLFLVANKFWTDHKQIKSDPCNDWFLLIIFHIVISMIIKFSKYIHKQYIIDFEKEQILLYT